MLALKRKILVVDDDPVIGKSFTRVLANKGYAVITATSGEDALQKLKAEKYDAVFADIVMPGMNGLEVAEQIKASQPWMPVVIITGNGTQEHEQRAEKAGVSEFLRKPLSPDMIEQSADKAMLTGSAAIAEEITATIDAVAEINAVTEVKKDPSWIKNVALFLISPFIGLAYLLAMPAVMAGILGTMAFKAMLKNDKIRSAVMLVAGPFIALGCLVAGPIAGLGALVYFGYKAATTKK